MKMASKGTTLLPPPIRHIKYYLSVIETRETTEIVSFLWPSHFSLVRNGKGGKNQPPKDLGQRDFPKAQKFSRVVYIIKPLEWQFKPIWLDFVW